MKQVDDMSNKERIEYLLLRYSEEKATLEELEELSSRLNNPVEEQTANEWLYNQLQQSSPSTDFDKNRLENILQQIHKDGPIDSSTTKPFRIRRWWPAAAAALILAFAGTYKLISNRTPQNIISANLVQSDILPGHSGAILHLSNGQKILLDSLQNGALAAQGNVQVIKKNGALEYIGNSDRLIYNTVTTNRGRQWQLTLSDGTKVWLNAESSIRYPLSFNGKERNVEITGEAYFEVVHNAKHPFKVLVKNQVIEDLGTTFNINAYKANVTTTLLSGSLRVHLADRSALLKPGQQARVDNAIHLRYAVNTEAITAWKNGLFQFDNADLQTIMEQIGRWYNVAVAYSGQPRIRMFSGKIPRDMPLSDVLKILKQLGVHFEVQHEKAGSGMAGKIVVSP
ncbi:MAG TPA: FecR domain-containing protein [Arachidicoccus sp.]|nr:FecR domain-containing protein [Arachidicoccus sp.]